MVALVAGFVRPARASSRSARKGSWRYDPRSSRCARSARSSGAMAPCSWSARIRATSSGRV